MEKSKHVCSKCGQSIGYHPVLNCKLACLGCGTEYTWEEWKSLKLVPKEEESD